MDIEKLETCQPEERFQILDKLLEEVKKSGGFLLVQNPLKFFNSIKQCLQDAQHEVALKSLTLIQEIIPDLGPDLDSLFLNLLPTVVVLLGHPKNSVRKQSFMIIGIYLQKSRNTQLVIQKLVMHGLQHNSWQVRQHALEHIPALLQFDQTYLSNLNEAKKMFEEVLIMFKDSSHHVRDTAKRTARQLQKMLLVTDTFELVYQRLSYNQQKVYQDEVGLSVNQIPIDLPTLDIEQIKQQAQITPHINSATSMLKPALNGLIFGFLEQEVVDQIQQGGKAKIAAVSKLENIITELDYNGKRQDALNYSASFLKYIDILLEDTNARISLSVLQILSEFVSLPGISTKANIPSVLPKCISKLGDSKVQIRQSVQKVLRKMVKIIKPNVFFSNLKTSFSSQN